MRTVFKHTLATCTALSLYGIVPATLNGQEAEQPAECTAEASPSNLLPGHPAIKVLVALSAPVGSDVGFAVHRDSGLELTDPRDIPGTELSAGQGVPPSIQVSSEDGTEVTLWLNTENAEPGSHELTLESGERACAGHIRISGGPAG